MQAISISTIINAPIEKVWDCFTQPAHIVNWNYAADTWHCPAAENELQPNGRFTYTMAAKDGSFSFDFGGTFTVVNPNTNLDYTLDDQRKVSVTFSTQDQTTVVTQTFEPENQNPVELQQSGWQAILDHFKRYVEA